MGETKVGGKKQTGIYAIFDYLHNNVKAVNDSKIFAGLMIIILNISSRFVTIKLSKSMEGYLKHTFSRDILVFAIAWMGTRDVYIALIIVAVFIICMDFLFNENSAFCCLPEEFTDYHTSLLENNDKVTDEDIKKAKEVLEKAKNQGKNSQSKTSNGTQYQDYSKP
jgi:hypothetical protein